MAEAGVGVAGIDPEDARLGVEGAEEAGVLSPWDLRFSTLSLWCSEVGRTRAPFQGQKS